MKKTLYSIFAAVALLSAASCEKDLEVYSEPTCRLNFYYDVDSRAEFDTIMAKASYSFVYGADDLKSDTLWYEMETMGFVTNNDRAITLVQETTDGDDAVAGKHYVSFSDPSMAHYYVIPAGKARTRIPVVMLRDASLQSQTVTLKFSIKANENFENGYPEYQTRVLIFTDQLAEPSLWINLELPYPAYPQYTYFGKWGPVKHKFLIDETGEKWDDEYIEKLLNGDSGYLTYMIRKMSKRLDAVNAERLAQGLDILREADGTPVEIPDPYAS